MFAYCPLSPTRQGEHRNIKSLANRRYVVAADAVLDQQQYSIRRNGLAAIEQNPAGLLIIPVVDDVLHEIGAASGRNCLEEIDRLESHAVREVGRPGPPLPGALQNLRLVGENTAQRRIRAQDGG